jgi:hypothetical protein
MPGKYIYAVNVIIDLPAYGKYASGRAHLKGEIRSEEPFTERGLREAIAKNVADEKGCDADGIEFVQFSYVELSI